MLTSSHTNVIPTVMIARRLASRLRCTLRASLTWPARRLWTMLEVPLPPLSLSDRDIERQLHRRNVVRTITPEVRALTRAISVN